MKHTYFQCMFVELTNAYICVTHTLIKIQNIGITQKALWCRCLVNTPAYSLRRREFCSDYSPHSLGLPVLELRVRSLIHCALCVRSLSLCIMF